MPSTYSSCNNPEDYGIDLENRAIDEEATAAMNAQNCGELNWQAEPDLSKKGRLYWYRYDGYHACPAWIDDLLGPDGFTWVWLPSGRTMLDDLRGDWWGPLPQPGNPAEGEVSTWKEPYER